MPLNDGKFIISSRIGKSGLPNTPGNAEKCQECLSTVWVSHSTLIQAGADTKVICMNCFQDLASKTKEKIEFRMPSKKCLSELSEVGIDENETRAILGLMSVLANTFKRKVKNGSRPHKNTL